MNDNTKPNRLFALVRVFMMYATIVGLLAFNEIIGPLSALTLIAGFFAAAWVKNISDRPRNGKRLVAVGVVGFCLAALCAAVEQFVRYSLTR